MTAPKSYRSQSLPHVINHRNFPSKYTFLLQPFIHTVEINRFDKTFQKSSDQIYLKNKMSSSIDIRVPPIFQSHQQLGDFVMPTSSYNSFVSKHKRTNYLINPELLTHYSIIENC